MLTTAAGLLLCVVYALAAPVEDGSKEVDILMPKVQPQKKDTYLCYGKKITKDVFLTTFVPHAHMQTAHHMLLFGCEAPGLSENVWNCGEMQAVGDDGQPQYPKSSPCAGGMKIIYAWGSDAPQLKLPEGVGFKVGPATNVKYLVLQVHYKNVDKFIAPSDVKDESGVSLRYTSKQQPRMAGVYMLGTAGVLPPHSIEYFEAACSIDEDTVMHPFAFRVHAHTHGKVNAAYRVRDNEWKEIGKQSPQKPQMFYDVSDKKMTIKKNDVVAMRCTMENKGNETIAIGSTQNDEMCNFYIMYYVDNAKLLKDDTCWTEGPPNWYFKDFKRLTLGGAPFGASKVPGSDNILEKTEHKATGNIGQQSDDITSLLMAELERIAEEEKEGERGYVDREFDDEEELAFEDILNELMNKDTVEEAPRYFDDVQDADRSLYDEDEAEDRNVY